MVDCIGWFHRAFLLFRAAERVWHVSGVVRHAPTKPSSSIYYLLDRISTTLGVLLFRACPSFDILSTLLTFSKGTFVGHAFDKHGPRPVLIVGSIILVFSIMMTSLSTQYYQYMLGQGILLGLGVGMM